jgi:hypothetical protein
MSERAELSERTYRAAERMAWERGMVLTNPSDGCYQLRHRGRGYIVNLYPRRKGITPRAYHDPHHRGPFLPLPENWTLLDAVVAAGRVWNKQPKVQS